MNLRIITKYALYGLFGLAFVTGDLMAQSGTKSSGSYVPSQTFEQKLWSYLKSVHYREWAPAGDNGDFQKSDAPHGALVKTYMNRVAAGNKDQLPNGSIIIKENFSPDKKLMAITLMYRSKGYNPESGDWYWAKFMPDGQVASMKTPQGSMKIAGKVATCIKCHSGADGDDFAFFND